MEAIPATIVVHGAVGAAGDAEDVANAAMIAEATGEQSVPLVAQQRRRHRGLPDLPPDISRFCYRESRFQSISAGRKPRFKKPIQPRRRPKFRWKLLLAPRLLWRRPFPRTNRSSPRAWRVPNLCTK